MFSTEAYVISRSYNILETRGVLRFGDNVGA
jgi:hypothetical protein